MGKKFLKFDNKVMVINGENVSITDKLEGGIYTLKFSQFMGLYLEPTNQFQLPEKLYGDITEKYDRICKSYEQAESSVGVLLSGIKGSGKTLLAKILANNFCKDIPVILVNQQVEQSLLIDFVTSLDDGVFIFDEFDKTFWNDADECEGDEPQNTLLTLLDGLYSTKKLFIFTCNMLSRISDFLIHRPSRIRYLFEYDVLDTPVVEEIANDMLDNKTYVENICVLADVYGTFTYDTLKALIDEVNMLGVSPFKAISGLNIRMEKTYDMKINNNYSLWFVCEDGLTYTREILDEFINPLCDCKWISVHNTDTEKQKRVCLGRDNLISYDKTSKEFSYKMPNGVLYLKRKEAIIEKDLEAIL